MKNFSVLKVIFNWKNVLKPKTRKAKQSIKKKKVSKLMEFKNEKLQK